MFPVYDPYSAIVYSADASNVDSVWVDGRQLVKGHRLCFCRPFRRTEGSGRNDEGI